MKPSVAVKRARKANAFITAQIDSKNVHAFLINHDRNAGTRVKK